MIVVDAECLAWSTSQLDHDPGATGSCPLQTTIFEIVARDLYTICVFDLDRGTRPTSKEGVLGDMNRPCELAGDRHSLMVSNGHVSTVEKRIL